MGTFKRKLAWAGAVGGLALFAGCKDNEGRMEDRQLPAETEQTRLESDDVQREGSHDLSGGPEEGTGGSGHDELLGGEAPEGSETQRDLEGYERTQQ